MPENEDRFSPELTAADLILGSLAESGATAAKLHLDIAGQQHAFLIQSSLAQVASAYALVSIAKSLEAAS